MGTGARGAERSPLAFGVAEARMKSRARAPFGF